MKKEDSYFYEHDKKNVKDSSAHHKLYTSSPPIGDVPVVFARLVPYIKKRP